MMKRYFAGFGLFTLVACSVEGEAQEWPSLPAEGFIGGRMATVDDVRDGNAAFSTNGTGLGAMDIAIPQFAYWTDSAGERVRVVVIQAEYGPNDMTIVGVRRLDDGTELVATLPEIELLGQNPSP